MKMRRLLLLVSASTVISGCHSTASIPVPAPGSQLQGNPQVVTVLRQDRSSIVVYNPAVVGDSLVGFLDPPRADSTATRQRVAMAIANVQGISTSKVSALKTTGVALGGAVVIYSVLVVIALVALASAY